jgi:transposase
VRKPGLRKINQYSEEFKATAVGLSSLRGVLIQDVAHSQDIHPFMRSRLRKEVREGKIVTKRVNLEPVVSNNSNGSFQSRRGRAR